MQKRKEDKDKEGGGEEEPEEEAHCLGFRAVTTSCVEPLPVWTSLLVMETRPGLIFSPISLHKDGRHISSVSLDAVCGAKMAPPTHTAEQSAETVTESGQQRAELLETWRKYSCVMTDD